MNELTITVTRHKSAPVLVLGRQGENQVTRVCFDCSELETLCGSGTAQLLHQRHGDDAPYPCAVTQEDSSVYWTLTNADTAKAGRGRAEVRWYVGDVLAKSVPYATCVLQALSEETEDAPEAYQDWVTQILTAVQSVKSAYQYAQESGYAGTEEEFAAKLAEKVPTEDIYVNTAARHTHENKDVLDEITGIVTGNEIGSAANSTVLSAAYETICEQLSGLNLTMTDLPNMEVFAYLYALILLNFDDYVLNSRFNELESRVSALEEAQQS